MATTEHDSEYLDQSATQCKVLGVDGDGWTHVYDQDREKIVVISRLGIDHQRDLSQMDRDLSDWMRFVGELRGWHKEQWVGYKYSEALGWSE